MGGGVAHRPFADQAVSPVRRDMVLVPEVGIARSRWRWPSLRGLALENFTVQRASRSFWRSLVGVSVHSSGTRPSLIAYFSASLLLCFGAATIEASTICSDIAK